MAEGKSRVRRRRTATAISASQTKAEQPGILTRVEDLVATNIDLLAINAGLRAENARLKELLSRIEQALGAKKPSVRRSVPEGLSGQVLPLKQPARATRKQPAKTRTRRPISDPATLEKRRAAMEKARAALAAKRAAAKAS